jgi:lysophospholipase L1-like esterase
VTREVADAAGCPYLDLQSRFADDPGLFLEPEVDQVHFNWKGSRIIADALAKTIVEQKLLP